MCFTITVLTWDKEDRAKKEKKKKTENLKHPPEREPSLLKLLCSLFNPGGNYGSWQPGGKEIKVGGWMKDMGS